MSKQFNILEELRIKNGAVNETPFKIDKGLKEVIDSLGTIGIEYKVIAHDKISFPANSESSALDLIVNALNKAKSAFSLERVKDDYFYVLKHRLQGYLYSAMDIDFDSANNQAVVSIC